MKRGSSFVKARSLAARLADARHRPRAAAARTIEDGGVYTRRTVCPQVAIPAATGDVTLFDPAGRTDAAAIDVVATITNVRSTCSESGRPDRLDRDLRRRRDAPRCRRGAHRRAALFRRRDAGRHPGRRQAHRPGRGQFPRRQPARRRARRRRRSASIARRRPALPADVRAKLTKRRKAGDVNAAIDPLSDPAVRAAVARATFEHLIGFQLDRGPVALQRDALSVQRGPLAPPPDRSDRPGAGALRSTALQAARRHARASPEASGRTGRPRGRVSGAKPTAEGATAPGISQAHGTARA